MSVGSLFVLCDDPPPGWQYPCGLLSEVGEDQGCITGEIDR